ncbi:hypothetical protein GALL_237630 [mine drainage metagenome]|uniref:Uncharacterized protein n=1 Tax=mine drainage metagenome TaxID=410659 RepID=A0A1J5S1L9_9ZZZZ
MEFSTPCVRVPGRLDHAEWKRVLVVTNVQNQPGIELATGAGAR